MNRSPTYMEVERARAHAWKRSTRDLPPEARASAQYVDKAGVAGGNLLDFCVPAEHAACSLLPEVREMAMALFRQLGIPWHAGVGDGPSNHLLSSQVQCVNALGLMVNEPERIARAFGAVLDVAEVLEIEPGRFLTFEYIGETDYFNEARGGQRRRGTHCTSVDAAFLYRSSRGHVELALIEWKYTESYRPRQVDPVKDAVRRKRYSAALTATDSPVRTDVLSFEDLLDEPLYQLMRQQLLAHELEKARAHGAERVWVVHVLPGANAAYQHSLRRSAQLAIGGTVSEIWEKVLRRPDRFLAVDSSVFLAAGVAPPEYDWRYGDNLAWDEAEVLRLCQNDVEDFLYTHVDFEGEVSLHEEGVELIVSYPCDLDEHGFAASSIATGTILQYPFSTLELCDLARDLDADVNDQLV